MAFRCNENKNWIPHIDEHNQAIAHLSPQSQLGSNHTDLHLSHEPVILTLILGHYAYNSLYLEWLFPQITLELSLSHYWSHSTFPSFQRSLVKVATTISAPIVLYSFPLFFFPLFLSLSELVILKNVFIYAMDRMFVSL